MSARSRKATSADAPALAALAARTFRQTYAAVNTPEDMDLHCARHFGADIQRAEIESPDRLTYVADEGGELLAYAQLRCGAHHGSVTAARPVEIQRFYVDAPGHGRGVAHALMQLVLADVTDRGHDVLWLGVWERNPRALAFYRKWNFEIVGETVFVLGQDPQRDHVMCRAIEQPA